MDRSYLSDQEVVAASRSFVCVRLLTYESAQEAELLLGLFRGRDGLENSVFGILDPSGEKSLVRAGRSPSWAFEDAAKMAESMQRIAKRYPGRKEPENVGLPLLADVRRGLNVARADSQPLVVVLGEGEERDALEAGLAERAWSEAFVGRFLYAHADGEDTDWSLIEGADERPDVGLLVIEPNEFGTGGRVLAQFDEVPSEEALNAARGEFESSAVDTRTLRRKGMREGVRWETAIPVTDRRGRGR